MIAFRKAHPVLMHQSPGAPYGYSTTSLHGVKPWQFDGSWDSHVIAVLFAGKLADGTSDFVYICVNSHWESHEIWLPGLPHGIDWQLVANTDRGEKAFLSEPELLNQGQPLRLGPRSVAVCESRPRGAARHEKKSHAKQEVKAST